MKGPFISLCFKCQVAVFVAKKWLSLVCGKSYLVASFPLIILYRRPIHWPKYKILGCSYCSHDPIWIIIRWSVVNCVLLRQLQPRVYMKRRFTIGWYSNLLGYSMNNLNLKWKDIFFIGLNIWWIDVIFSIFKVFPFC